MANIRPIMESRWQVIGRIRMGHLEEKVSKAGNSYTSGAYLDHWRLTSPIKSLLDQAVELGWGDEVTQWDSPTGPQWQLYTRLTEIECVIPPWEEAYSVNYEEWKSNLLVRRCNGIEITASGDDSEVGQECICAAQTERNCKRVSRLSLLLPEIDGMGVWRYDTTGINGSLEIAQSFACLRELSARGYFVKCALTMVDQVTRDPSTGTTHKSKKASLQPKASLLQLIGGCPPDHVLALPPPRRAQPHEIASAMETLGHGNELPAVHHHQIPQHASREPEGNPFAPDREYSHIAAPSQGKPTDPIVVEPDPDAEKAPALTEVQQQQVADIIRQCKQLSDKADSRRYSLQLLRRIFGDGTSNAESIGRAVQADDPKSTKQRFFASCVIDLMNNELPGEGAENMTDWVKAFDAWFSQQEERFIGLQTGKGGKAFALQAEGK